MELKNIFIIKTLFQLIFFIKSILVGQILYFIRAILSFPVINLAWKKYSFNFCFSYFLRIFLHTLFNFVFFWSPLEFSWCSLACQNCVTHRQTLLIVRLLIGAKIDGTVGFGIARREKNYSKKLAFIQN